MTIRFSTDPATILVPLIPVPAPTTAVTRSTSSNVTEYWESRIIENKALAEKLFAIFQQVMRAVPTDVRDIMIGYCVEKDPMIETMSLNSIEKDAFEDGRTFDKPFPYYRVIINEKYYIPIQIITQSISLFEKIINKTKNIYSCAKGAHCMYLAGSTEEPPIATLVGTGTHAGESQFQYNTDEKFPKSYQAGVEGDRFMIYPFDGDRCTYTLIGIGIASYEVEKVTVSQDK